MGSSPAGGGGGRGRGHSPTAHAQEKAGEGHQVALVPGVGEVEAQPAAQRGLLGAGPGPPGGQAAPAAAQALAELLAEQGEGPEVEQQLQGAGRARLEVDEQHPGEEQQEEEVADHVAHEGGHRRPPELRPASQARGAPPAAAAAPRLSQHPHGLLLPGLCQPGGRGKGGGSV